MQVNDEVSMTSGASLISGGGGTGSFGGQGDGDK